ncbi:hypothetical protein JCM11251_006888 [Rhodosporidiobolus azoricus]
MSMVDFRPRTVSSQLRGAAGLDDSTGSSGSLAWNDWGANGYSPDRPATAAQPYLDPYADLISENTFTDFHAQRTPQPQFQSGLGFEVQMGMGGIEEEPAGGEGEAAGQVTHPGDGTLNSSAIRLAGAQHAQSSYPASSCSSPARSRASSLHSIAPPNLQMSTLTSPASPFFPGGLPSPFHEPSSAFSSSTINPAHSVRSSSPSDTSSVSGLNTSRIESGSTTSSIYGGNSGGDASTAPSTPYRSNSISSRGTQSHQKHLRRRSSPIKGARHARKLSNADRKAICQFHLTHPGLKQDDIGAHFGFERSTISKTLKYKERYLAMDSDDESSATAVIRSARQESTDHGSVMVASSSISSLHSLDSHDGSSIFGASTSSRPSAEITGGRFPQIDNALAAWAREQVPLGQPLTDSMMQRQARQIARDLGSDNFKASQTWLDGFKQRAGISHGVFHDLIPTHSPPAPVPTPRPTSQAFLSPPKEEDDEEELVVVHEDEGDDDYDLPGTRRSKRRLGGKTVRRLTSAKSALASFADGMLHRSSTPQRAAAEVDLSGVLNGGNFGDLSMDADATPTHTTVHSRASTTATERPNGLAQPFSYSPTAVSETGSVVTSTPSRAQYAPSPLILGQNGNGNEEYSPPESLSQSSAYGYPTGLAASYSSQDLASSQSSLANFDGGNAYAASGFDSATASPAPMYAHQQQRHGRSGSTASTNSVYSGLTAFSTSHSQGPGTPLTGSLYGSFRDSQSNLCSVPGTPATTGSTGCFGGAAEQQSQFQAAFPTAVAGPSSASSQYSQPSSSGASSSSQHPHNQHSSHQRYPHHSNTYPGTPNNPHPPPFPSSSTHDQSGSAGRRATISGGAPFAGRSTAMSHSLSLSQLPSAAVPRSSVSLEQAFSSLEIALGFLSTSAGQDYVSPKDIVVLSDLRAKMERARNAQGVNLAAINSAPATPSTLGPSPFMQQSPFFAQQQQAPIAAFANASASPMKAQRMRLARTQSTSAVPQFGAMGTAGALERGMLTRRSGSALSLYEVDGH